MLRELVDDVGFARRIDPQRPDARPHERFPIRHPKLPWHPAFVGTYACLIRATRFSAAKNVFQLRRCAFSVFWPSAVRR